MLAHRSDKFKYLNGIKYLEVNNYMNLFFSCNTFEALIILNSMCFNGYGSGSGDTNGLNISKRERVGKSTSHLYPPKNQTNQKHPKTH